MQKIGDLYKVLDFLPLPRAPLSFLDNPSEQKEILDKFSMVLQEGKQTSTGQQPLSLLLEVVPFFSIAFQIWLPLLLYVGLISGQEGLWRCRSGEGT